MKKSIKQRLYFNTLSRSYRVVDADAPAAVHISRHEISVLIEDIGREAAAANGLSNDDVTIVDSLNNALNRGWTYDEMILIEYMEGHFEFDSIRYVIKMMGKNEPPVIANKEPKARFTYFVRRELRDLAIKNATAAIEEALANKIANWKKDF